MGATSVKGARESPLYPVRFRGGVLRGDPARLGDLGVIEALEVEEDDLAIGRAKLAHERDEPFQGVALLGIVGGVAGRGGALEVLDRDAALEAAPRAAHHVPDGDVVRDAVNPRAKRGPSIEGREPTPERDVDLLQEIALPVDVGLVPANESLERRAERARDLAVVVRFRAGRAFTHLAYRHHSAGTVPPSVDSLQTFPDPTIAGHPRSKSGHAKCPPSHPSSLLGPTEFHAGHPTWNPGQAKRHLGHLADVPQRLSEFPLPMSGVPL
jgi:hypothetical protein